MDDEILKSLTDHSIPDFDLYDEQESIGEGESGTVYKLTSSEYTVTPICKKEYKIKAKSTESPNETVTNEFKNGKVISALFSPKYCLFIDTYLKVNQTGGGLFSRLFRRTPPADGNVSLVSERIDKPPALFLQYFPSNIKVVRGNWHDPETNKPIPDENIYEIIYQVVYVLIKETKFRHNDIKPDNIMIYKLQDPITFKFDSFLFNTRYIAKLIDYELIHRTDLDPYLDLFAVYNLMGITGIMTPDDIMSTPIYISYANLSDVLKETILTHQQPVRPTRVVFECDGIHLVKRIRTGGKRRNTKAKKRTTRRRWTKRV